MPQWTDAVPISVPPTPSSLSASLASALAGINARKGAAAAAATSTLNPVAGNNFAYVASYTTVTWKGNLEARGINVDTGVVSTSATWCAENVTADTCAAPGTVVADTSGATTTYNCVTPNAVICTGGTHGRHGLLRTGSDRLHRHHAQPWCPIPATREQSIPPTATGTALINFDAAMQLPIRRTFPQPT